MPRQGKIMNDFKRRRIHPNHKLYHQCQLWRNNYEVVKLLEHIAWLHHSRKQLKAKIKRLEESTHAS